MAHIFCDNRMIKEFVETKFGECTTTIRIWPTEQIEPNDYMCVYVFDVVHPPENNNSPFTQFSEAELKEANHDWFEKNWPFVKQSANAGCAVHIYVGKWFEYLKHHRKFVHTTCMPRLGGDGVMLTGDDDKLSYKACKSIEMLFQRLILDREHSVNVLQEEENYTKMCIALVEKNESLL